MTIRVGEFAMTEPLQVRVAKPGDEEIETAEVAQHAKERLHEEREPLLEHPPEPRRRAG